MRNLILYSIIIVFNIQHIYAQTSDSSNIQIINKYLLASNNEKQRIEKKIIKLNPNFDFLFNCLKQGKVYKKDIPTGFFERYFKNDRGIEHPNIVFIPFKYNPRKSYPVQIFLHGGISTLDTRQISNLLNKLDTSWNSVNTICLFPASWFLSPWWSYNQYENISRLLSFIKENYNIDENDICLKGVSDGATGIFYLSNFYQTPFSCYVPLIGDMHSLTALTDKQFYLKNYQGLSFLAINGKKDELFDISEVVPAMNELKKTAKELKFIVVDSSKHNLRWYPALNDTIKNFIKTHKRNPYPDIIYYATEKPDTFCRKFWVRIDRIGNSDEGNIEDINQITINQKSVSMFLRQKLFGQIEVNKLGNIVYVRTENVKKYTLLISPEHFDLSKPIEVYTNNLLSFKGRLTKNIKTLIKYNIEDNDRKMLFSNELKITVGKKFKG